MNLHTRQVRLYFPHYNRVRVLTDETSADITDILLRWIAQERHFSPIYGVIQHPGDTNWVIEYSLNEDQLNNLR